MKKFVIRTCIFVACIIVVFQVLGRMWDHHFSSFDNRYVDHKSPWIFQHQDQQYDYAIMGSSRALNVLDVLSIDAINGTRGVNIATAGSNFAANYLILQKYWEQGNRFNTLILNVDYSAFHADSSYSYPFADYAFLPISNVDYVDDIFYDQLPTWKYCMWKVAPFAKYVEYSSHYPFYDNIRYYGVRYENAVLDSTCGSDLLFDEEPEFPEKTKIKRFLNPDEEDLKYFEKIIAFCNANEIKLVLYEAPYYEELYEYRNYEEISDSIGIMAADRGVVYYGLGRHPLSKDRSNFKDYTHLNGDGALKFSTSFAEMLKRDGLL